MLFLIFFNIEIQFIIKEFIQKSYITLKALLTTKKIELIIKKNLQL